MLSYIFFIGDSDEAVTDKINPKVLRREYSLETALTFAAQLAEKEGELIRVYHDDGESIHERFVINSATVSEYRETGLLVEVLKDAYERTHRLIEQAGLEDFDMLKALHSEGYWRDEREDIRAYLERYAPYYAKAIIRQWHKEFDDEYKEARGENDDVD